MVCEWLERWYQRALVLHPAHASVRLPAELTSHDGFEEGMRRSGGYLWDDVMDIIRKYWVQEPAISAMLVLKVVQ